MFSLSDMGFMKMAWGICAETFVKLFVLFCSKVTLEYKLIENAGKNAEEKMFIDDCAYGLLIGDNRLNTKNNECYNILKVLCLKNSERTMELYLRSSRSDMTKRFENFHT